MNGRAGHLVEVACLSIVAASIVLISVKSQGTTHAALQPSKQSNQYITISSAVTPTLEPRVYLSAVMRDFCQPVTVPADAKLFGVVFFDYNGDGSQQSDEPGIIGASISVGSQSTSSQCNGVYYFRNLPDGSHNLTVTAAGFRYISRSTGDFSAVETPIVVTVNGNTRQDVGLMQGFLTLPFSRGSQFTRSSPFGMASVFDLDPRIGFAKAYDPAIKPVWEATKPPGSWTIIPELTTVL